MRVFCCLFVLVPTPGEHLSIPVTTIARDVPYSVVFSPNSRPITGIRPAMLSCQRVTNRNQLQPHALCQLRHRTSDKLPRRPRVFGDRRRAGTGMVTLARRNLGRLPNVQVETSRFEEWDDRGRRYDALVAASA